MTKLRNLDVFDLPYARQSRFPSAPKLLEVVGIDTETYKGFARLVCDSNGSSAKINSFDDSIDYLTRKSLRGTLNFFYNLDYDITAFLKYLSIDYLDSLYCLNKTTYKGFKLFYLPSKHFAISVPNQRLKYYFWDLAQFYNTSLNNASSKYLGKEKLDLDPKKLSDWDFWKENYKYIVRYCTQDARLTQQLGELMQDKSLKIGVPFHRPYSKGYLASRYFISNARVPRLERAMWHNYALKSYFGGRFEVFVRGYFPRAYQYDINSAYPFWIKQLPDFTRGVWYESNEVLDDATVGFVKCYVKVASDFVAPVPYDLKGLIIYPCFEGIRYLSLKEFLYYEQDPSVELDPIDGFFFFEETHERPFKTLIDSLFHIKNEVKGKDKSLYLFTKIIMNAFYGKTLETNKILVPTKNELEAVTTIDSPDYEEQLFKPKLKIGQCFYPVIGVLITAWTRLQLYKMLRRYSDNLIATFTDCMFTNRELPLTSHKLGGWNKEIEGELIMIQSGVYTIRNDETVKTANRGFRPKEKVRGKDEVLDLIDLLERNKKQKCIKHKFIKVQRLGETLKQIRSLNLADLNIFMEVEKEINLNADRKREWERNADDCRDLLENRIYSVPKSL